MTKRNLVKIEFNSLLKFIKIQERERNKFVKRYCKRALKVMRKQWGAQLWELHDAIYVRDCRDDLKFVDSEDL